ncbi:hypothetical protein SBA3_1190024 [Candidatus Sulfopaludibacter sp. SbA3]|nr:hypothetical protein SBA3_1190024 [Candidatus Sulfopaludibacter sp. SbA3]
MAERGLAYCPANRPMRITGFLAPTTSTRLICSSSLSMLVMRGGLQSTRRSAQSPPCNTNRLPTAASASCCRSCTISQLTTRGGSWRNSARTRSTATGSGYSGCCNAGNCRHESGCQLERLVVLGRDIKSHGNTDSVWHVSCITKETYVWNSSRFSPVRAAGAARRHGAGRQQASRKTSGLIQERCGLFRTRG